MQRVQAEASKISIPVLIMQGSDDRLVDPDDGQLLYDLVGSSDKTLKMYPGLHHEIFNEPERDQVFADMQAWLKDHI
jgi:alpha-beta hydrolase superfamily lysophospholipase